MNKEINDVLDVCYDKYSETHDAHLVAQLIAEKCVKIAQDFDNIAKQPGSGIAIAEIIKAHFGV